MLIRNSKRPSPNPASRSFAVRRALVRWCRERVADGNSGVDRDRSRLCHAVSPIVSSSLSIFDKTSLFFPIELTPCPLSFLSPLSPFRRLQRLPSPAFILSTPTPLQAQSLSSLPSFPNQLTIPAISSPLFELPSSTPPLTFFLHHGHLHQLHPLDRPSWRPRQLYRPLLSRPKLGSLGRQRWRTLKRHRRRPFSVTESFHRPLSPFFRRGHHRSVRLPRPLLRLLGSTLPDGKEVHDRFTYWHDQSVPSLQEHFYSASLKRSNASGEKRGSDPRFSSICLQ
jgi:hypothetical protein